MVPTLDSRIPLDALYSSILFTLVRLRLDPRLHPFVPAFEEVLLKWWGVYKQERSLLDNRLTAKPQVAHADADLDATSDGVAGTVLIETKNNRRSPLLTRYFGSQQPHRFRRSVLGPQLAAMRAWPPLLIESANPTLKAYSELLVTQIAAADEAVQRVSEAEQELKDFRMFGERQKLFNEVNGLRKKLHGNVAKLCHAHPEWGVGRAYVEALFEHEAARPELSEADLERKIATLNADVSRLMAVREQRAKDTEAEAQKRAEAEKKAKLALLEAAEKVAAEASAKLAALKADLDSKNAGDFASELAGGAIDGQEIRVVKVHDPRKLRRPCEGCRPDEDHVLEPGDDQVHDAGSRAANGDHRTEQFGEDIPGVRDVQGVSW